MGVVLYMQQEGRGIGLLSKLQAYKLQEQGLDTWKQTWPWGILLMSVITVWGQILRDLDHALAVD